MIERAYVTASDFRFEADADMTVISLRVATPGCHMPKNMAVLTYDPDTVADASPTWSAYKMKCELCGVEKRMNEREFNLYKYLTEGNKK